MKSSRPDLTIRFSFHKASYHDVALRKLPKPDCVSALNCGFIFYRSWDASIPYMLKWPGVPLVFSEYYMQDCEANLEKVDELVQPELEMWVEPSVNPFCSSLPARLPTGLQLSKFKRRNVIMSNDFLCVVTWS